MLITNCQTNIHPARRNYTTSPNKNRHLCIAIAIIAIETSLHMIYRSLLQLCSNDYRDYAEVCFKEFGDRVKHWITFNEPGGFCSAGYASGVLAPGRCSPWEQGNCSVGDSGTEPYTVCHHQLLAHAETVRLYKEKYQVGDELPMQFHKKNGVIPKEKLPPCN